MCWKRGRREKKANEKKCLVKLVSHCNCSFNLSVWSAQSLCSPMASKAGYHASSMLHWSTSSSSTQAVFSNHQPHYNLIHVNYHTSVFRIGNLPRLIDKASRRKLTLNPRIVFSWSRLIPMSCIGFACQNVAHSLLANSKKNDILYLLLMLFTRSAELLFKLLLTIVSADGRSDILVY